MKLTYKLSLDTEHDLRGIARYTAKRWGKTALANYKNGLKHTFDMIGNSTVQARTFSSTFPDLFVN